MCQKACSQLVCWIWSLHCLCDNSIHNSIHSFLFIDASLFLAITTLSWILIGQIADADSEEGELRGAWKGGLYKELAIVVCKVCWSVHKKYGLSLMTAQNEEDLARSCSLSCQWGNELEKAISEKTCSLVAYSGYILWWKERASRWLRRVTIIGGSGKGRLRCVVWPLWTSLLSTFFICPKVVIECAHFGNVIIKFGYCPSSHKSNALLKQIIVETGISWLLCL